VEEERVTVLMASHDGLVTEYVDEVLELKDGQILQDN
jgi:ABC-type lipoprotein export system ATPase subunit